jgi:hypothetical protein
MKKMLALAILSAAFAAASPAMAQNSQQTKMGVCNDQAKGKTGDDRKAFMKQCLSAAKPPTQQEKMKLCNQDATGKKGDDRKAFMKDCLSSKKG